MPTTLPRAPRLWYSRPELVEQPRLAISRRDLGLLLVVLQHAASQGEQLGKERPGLDAESSTWLSKVLTARATGRD